jgi:HEAT repeat protein
VGPADPETSLQQEILRVLLMNNPDRGIEVASDRLKADASDPVVLANLSGIATSSSSKALPLLISIAKTSPSMKARRDATFWLARSRTDKDSLVGTLLEILGSTQDAETENAATNALAEINTPRAMSALTDIAKDKNKSTAVRRSALNSLSRFNTPSALSTYEDLYRNASDTVEIRRTLVNLIGRSTEPRVVTILANIAKTDSDLTVRRIAVQFLGMRKEPEAMRALEDLLK